MRIDVSQAARTGISRRRPLGLLRKDDAMPEGETRKTKHIACAAVVPGCPFTASAETEEELLQKVAAHAAHDHGVTEITPELAAKVKAAIESR
jgi:predicted small metal-binding protein